MRIRLNVTILDLGYISVPRLWIARFNFLFHVGEPYILQFASLYNITGLGPEMPKRKHSIEDKLRRNLKRTFSILSEEAITKDMYTEDKMGFSFLYKATYTCVIIRWNE